MNGFKRLGGIAACREEVKLRTEHVKKIIIHHPQYDEILQQLEDILYMSDGSVSPEQLFIYGPTGMGKSTVTKEFTKRYPSFEVETTTRKFKKIPVLYLRVPPKATPKSLAAKMLEKMGDVLYSSGTEILLTRRIHHYIRELEIRMIVLDEFQHLIDADTDHVLTTAANWVKTFSEESGIPIVLCGMPNSVKIFAKEEQLDRRYSYKIWMEPFKYSTAEEKILFRAFLNKIEDDLPFADPSNINLANVQMADKFFYISLGVPFYVMKVLEFATEDASKKGEDKLTELHLQQALRKLKQITRPFRVNPFNRDDFNLIDELAKESAQEEKLKLNTTTMKRRSRNKV
ncbi:TniB family NTP-binding protein [Paenibacillus sp. 7523-1]|uniref:TniB family NTP-binding protein n=1 Tax=Paenibacillus sp. 7523-1 TaxID=2022550 RepID=UPI000BA68DDC|nr:TniB family NTP-binding protein [Paenibacillus sp. 7523-1]PAD28714.1 hypothetical protein CHH60_23730 [Paenibacillus sp. 7523-1]